ncbi:cell filamentation protein Fic [Pseudomonas fluorescens]|uniref:Cell filamentation protein Fic n=1 Tax=Pseudomonas fluorescens TaxID=294 RepID=A0A3S4SV75_PSEFL|nr:cell filamentation protein Fic [Pseudomonas fluorescens]
MTFDPFGDFDTEGYLQNSLKLKNPIEVKESEHLSFGASLEDALAYLAKKKRSTPKLSSKPMKFSFPPFIHGREKTETNWFPISRCTQVRKKMPITSPRDIHWAT